MFWGNALQGGALPQNPLWSPRNHKLIWEKKEKREKVKKQKMKEYD